MLEILRSRRSVRRFEDRQIEEEKLEVLKESLVRSPSSRSINPREFIFVEDRKVLEQLSRSKEHGAGFLSSAAVGVAVLGDTTKSDTCIEDCSIAAITLQYAAEFLELGSCWCQVRLRAHSADKTAEEYVREILGIQDHYLVECVIGVGYPAQDKVPHAHEDLDWDKVRVYPSTKY